MKISAANPKSRQSGSAVIVMLTLLVIISIYVGANLRTINYMGSDFKLIEKQQIRRAQKITVRTNLVQINFDVGAETNRLADTIQLVRP